MPSPYLPSNWYWRVADDPDKVYSSKAGDYIPVDDSDYVDWLSLGNRPVPVPSEAELGGILDPLALRPKNAGVLDGFKESQARRITVEAAFKMILQHENRLRAIERQLSLNSSPADVPQTPAAIRALVKSVT